MSSTEAPSPRSPDRDPLALAGQSLWRWLNSLPVAVWVMILLAFLSMLGTMIPQEHLAQPPGGLSLEEMYVQRFGASRAALIRGLGLSRIYFTWYFNFLLIWLCVSAVICNIVRYRRTAALWRAPGPLRKAPFFQASKRAVIAQGAGETEYSRLRELLAGKGYRIREAGEDGARCLYADKGFLSRWALVVLHVAVLVLLFGGMYGKAVGVEGNVMLADGEKKDLELDIVTNKHRYVQPLLKLLPPLVFELDQKAYRIDYLKQIQLGSEILKMPEDLHDYYRYIVHDYVSDLTVKRGSRVKQGEVKVNHPLVIDKLNLYQSGYHQTGYLSLSIAAGEAVEAELLADTPSVITSRGVAVQDGPGGAWLLPVPGTQFGKVTALPQGTPVSDLLYEFEQVKAGDYYDGGVKAGYIGPLTIAHMYEPQSGQYMGSRLITPDKPLALTVNGQPALASMSRRVDNYSIFSYKRDPGIPVLYFGWILMIAGVALTLYIPFSQLYLRYEQQGGKLYILGAGLAFRRGAPLTLTLREILAAATVVPAREDGGGR